MKITSKQINGRYTTIGLVCFVFCFLIAALLLTYRYFHNFDTVIPGQVYRSRQLSPQGFHEVFDKYHIKSILNLRGANPGEAWYQDEMKISQQFRVKHYDIALQSKALPNDQTLQFLIDTIKNSPKPLLIHCESGVDRTGFASALALILLAHADTQIAQKQVSWRYFVFSNHSIGRLYFQRTSESTAN